jgi:hypothetical protein
MRGGNLVLVFASLIPAVSAEAQWRLTAVTVSAERAVTDFYDLGAIETGERMEARFRLRNTGAAPASFTPITVAGSGFSVEAPAPFSVAPGGAVDFLVRFQPRSAGAFSAALQTSYGSTILRAAATPAALVRLESGEELPGGAIIDFGIRPIATSAARRLVLANTSLTLLTPPTLAISGADYALRGTVPPQLAAGETAVIELVFTPSAIGLREARLDIGAKRFTLRGQGAPPPLKFTLIADSLVRSGEQRRVTLHFDDPAFVAADGLITLDLEGGLTDPAVVFANGSRRYEFRVRPGDREFSFDYQAGASAGIIRFHAVVSDQVQQASVQIAPEAVRVTQAEAARETGALTVRINGFDNTRSASRLVFVFLDAGGAELARQAVDAETLFRDYFATPGAGGVFSLSARFPVTGDASRVAAVETQLINLMGTARAQSSF